MADEPLGEPDVTRYLGVRRGEDLGRGGEDQPAWRAGGMLAAIAVAATLAGFLFLYAQRLSDHVANVDDYLYTLQTEWSWHAFSSGAQGMLIAWRGFPTNSP